MWREGAAGDRGDGRGESGKQEANLEWAHKRSVRMIVGRLRGYGLKWRTWVNKNTHTTRASEIPEKHKDKEILEQTAQGDYYIHPVLWEAAQA